MSHGTMVPKPGREGDKSTKVTTQPVRLPRDIQGQNRKGNGDPYKR